MEAKHTKGPWDVTSSAAGDGRLIVEDDIGHPICALSLRGVQGDFVKMSANARLIAAAPDLLQALQAALAYNDAAMAPDGSGQFSWGPTARAAIAKATGET